MTIRDAIGQIDSLKHNTYSNADKVRWISRLDWMVKNHIIDTHEKPEHTEFAGYTADTDPDTRLLVGEPHDEMYIRWLEAQIDYANGEYDKYNNSIAMFQAAYDGFQAFYNRTHMPIGQTLKFF